MPCVVQYYNPAAKLLYICIKYTLINMKSLWPTMHVENAILSYVL